MPRQQPERVKQQIVNQRGYKTIRVLQEMIAEFDYQPTACRRSYRVVIVRKRLGIEQGAIAAVRGISLFLLLTNDRDTPAEDIVFSANDRCNQENLIAQLKSGVYA